MTGWGESNTGSRVGCATSSMHSARRIGLGSSVLSERLGRAATCPPAPRRGLSIPQTTPRRPNTPTPQWIASQPKQARSIRGKDSVAFLYVGQEGRVGPAADALSAPACRSRLQGSVEFNHVALVKTKLRSNLPGDGVPNVEHVPIDHALGVIHGTTQLSVQ